MVRSTVRTWGLAGLVAVLLLVVAQGFNPRPAAAQPSPKHVVAALGFDCLEGHLWPGGVRVDVKLRDSDGNVVYATTATTDPSGSFVVNPRGRPYVFCDIPVTLRPGMTYTASDGSATKSLVIEAMSFDRLDPETQTAAGTAPAGRTVQVYIYWGGQAGNDAQWVNARSPAGPGGDWFVDIGAIGGKVELGSQGDAFLADDGADGNVDFTRTTIWVTSLSLTATPAPAASSATAEAAGASVSRPGARVRLSGRLSARTKACVSRKQVRLLTVAGKRSRVLASARTNEKGGYSFLRRVMRTTRFRVQYRGNRVCQPSKSRVRTVRVAGRKSTR